MSQQPTVKSLTKNETDKWVDDAILSYISPDAFQSFFLFAGAGSGKTGTLVNVLKKFKENYGRAFRLKKQKVAIITYTNAAADEIMSRLEHDPIFLVSTIHSFAWSLIKSFTHDIKDWLRKDLKTDIDKLEEEQSRSRNLQNKTSIDRARRIELKRKRLASLDSISKFVYNPNGDNITKDSLNHTEVISIAADFISMFPVMQRIFVCQYPILFIDESQDTKEKLIDAVFGLQQAFPKEICVGLFGDTMQRIYADGKENLDKSFPETWKTPNKKLNHRSNKRIIALINNIRAEADGQQQLPREEKFQGTVRIFICSRGGDKAAIEERVTRKMAEITGDVLWNTEADNVKTLILEHHMAAKRMGFLEFFEPLYKESALSTGLLEGNLSSISLLTKIIIPLLNAHKANDEFEKARIVKRESRFFDQAELKASGNPIQQLEKAKNGIENLFQLWDNENEPKIIEVVKSIYDTGIFQIPVSILPLVARTAEEIEQIKKASEIEKDEGDGNEELKAWEEALSQPFSQIIKYDEYLSTKSKFGTHQGVKGLEYPRVLVVIDDEESRGFMFKYDKLFGLSELTATDKKNLEEGKDTSVDRARRLFYVACSRARESLAVVAYTNDPGLLKQYVLNNKWFAEDEIELM